MLFIVKKLSPATAWGSTWRGWNWIELYLFARASLVIGIYGLVHWIIFEKANGIFLGNEDYQVFGVIFGLLGLRWLFFAFRRGRGRKVKASQPREKSPYEITLPGRPNLEIRNPFRGIIAVGGAGSGKSESVIKPVIADCIAKGFSALIYDFKYPELASSARKEFDKLNSGGGDPFNRKIYELDFTEPRRSHAINPLRYVKKQEQAREIARAIFLNLVSDKKDFFSDQSQYILAGAIWHFARNYKELFTIPHILSFLLTTEKDIMLDELASDVETKAMVSGTLNARGSANTVASILSTLTGALQTLHSESTSWILGRDDDIPLDINSRENPAIITIGTSPEIQETTGAAISIIATTLFRICNQKNRLPCLIAFDELPTLYIPKFDTIPATGRSNKIATLIGVQDISQVERRYGNASESIMSNLAYQCYGRTVNPRTQKRIIDLFGKKEQEVISRTSGESTSAGGDGTSIGRSTSKQVRERVVASDINDLGAGEFFFITPRATYKGYQIANPEHETTFLPEKATEEEIADHHAYITIQIQNLMIEKHGK